MYIYSGGSTTTIIILTIAIIILIIVIKIAVFFIRRSMKACLQPAPIVAGKVQVCKAGNNHWQLA